MEFSPKLNYILRKRLLNRNFPLEFNGLKSKQKENQLQKCYGSEIDRHAETFLVEVVPDLYSVSTRYINAYSLVPPHVLKRHDASPWG